MRIRARKRKLALTIFAPTVSVKRFRRTPPTADQGEICEPPGNGGSGPTQVQIEQCAFRNDGLLVKSPSLRSENKNIGREFVQPEKNAPTVSEETSVKSEAQRRYFEANKSKLK
jgi:hypothetical protein